MTIQRLVNAITSGQFDAKFRELYGSSERMIMKQRARYISAAEHFSRTYPECDDVKLFSSPAIINIGGDTYHHGGSALAAAVTCDIIAISGANEDKMIRIESSDFPCLEISLDGTFTDEDEKNKYSELIEKNNLTNGFNAYISSDIPSDHGFSADDVLWELIKAIVNNYNDDILTTEEFLTAELNDSSESHTNAAYCDFSSLGYSMCITAVSGGNSRKSGDNDEMLRGMEEAAEYFGRKLLCDVDEDEFYKELPKMRKNCSDTAVLSAIRFFEEERIASEEAKALEIGDTEEFFRLLNQSGRYSVSQEAAVALAVSERFLGGSGAVRVCANESIQAFVPSYIAADYTAEMNSIFGEKSCHISGVRSIFPCCIK